MENWTNDVNIFSFDFILFPIHIPLHWFLAVVDMHRPSISVYDSHPSRESAETCMRHIQGYLYDEYENKKRRPLCAKFSSIIPSNIPLQNNGFDCGVFLCQYAKSISRREPFSFCQQDMPAIRRTMTWELVTNNLSSSATIHDI